MYTNGVNKEMDDIEVDGLIPHVQSKTFTVNGDENNDVKFSETDSSAAPGNNERNRYQRLSNQDSKQMYTNGVNKEMDDIEADGLIPHVQSKTFTVNGDENNDVKFSETDSSAAPGNNERNRYQRLSNQDSIQMYTNGVNKEMDDIEADGLIPHVQSKSFTVNGDGDNDVEFSETDSSAAPGNNVRILYQRLRTQDSIQLDDSPFVSEIFVKHADEDSVKGDPLGGFLCTGSRSDGTFLHAFCSLQPDGILAKDFSVKDKDILVSLNGKKTLGSFEYDHEVVLALFRTLPMTEKISMVIYNRKSETFTTIEFLLEGTKEEVIVKENSVKLMTMQPKVKVLMAQKDSTSLAVRNEELTLRQSASVMSDCTYHFIVRKWLDGGYYLKYSFQVQKNKSKFLGLNGTQLDIVNDTDVASIKTFRKEKILRDVYLRPCGRDDLYLCFNQTRKLFELKTREHVLKEEGCGIFMINTFCPP